MGHNNNYRHIVALSGGKDSVAMAIRLKEVFTTIDFDYLITPTGNELPEMDDHWINLETILGKKLIRLKPFDGDGLLALIREKKTIPNWRMRFCTRILKIEPTIKYLMDHSPCIQYVGLRYDESERRGLYGEIDNVIQRYPLKEWKWDKKRVTDYLVDKGITIPVRTDCALCFFQRLKEWKSLWKNHLDMFNDGVKIEKEIDSTFRSPRRDTWSTDLEGLSQEFNDGRRVRGENNSLSDSNCDREDLCRVCSM